jgi:hypothetical protein
MDFHPAAAIAHSRLSNQGGDAKRMVRSHFILMKWQFINSPFFNYIAVFWAIARSVI